MPEIHHFKIPLVGDPTRPDRPGDMYDAETVGAEKDLGPATGVAINGINIQVTRTKLGRSNTLSACLRFQTINEVLLKGPE